MREKFYLPKWLCLFGLCFFTIPLWANTIPPITSINRSAITLANGSPSLPAIIPVDAKAVSKLNQDSQKQVVLPSLVDASRPITSSRLWNLQDADILSIINEVSQETGKNFVVDPRVSGKITLISSKPLRQAQVYQVFLSILSLLGYSAIPSGNVIKIVPNIESGEQATRVATKFAPGSGDEVVVRVIPLENVSASQLIPVLRPMLPQWSNISSYTPGNVLILLGRAANLERKTGIS